MKYYPYLVSNDYKKLKNWVDNGSLNIIGFINEGAFKKLIRIYRPINADYIEFSQTGWSIVIFDNENFEKKCREYGVEFLMPTVGVEV